MTQQSEPITLIREAIAKHIKEVAEELTYWMEELNKLEQAAPVTSPVQLERHRYQS